MDRLQKVIAQAGVASRRKAEEMISEGRVCVNGVVHTTQGYIVKKKDIIEVDGKSILKEEKVYYIMNKPKKVVCTNDDEHERTTVTSLMDCRERVFCVGRLDYDTSGAIIITNDGDFANMIMHPAFHIPKVYNLTINGLLKPTDISMLKEGITLDDGYKTMAARVKITEKDREKQQSSFDLTILEGRNHQVKRMMEALGYKVRRLHRKQIAFLMCSDLRQGEYRKLKPYEIKRLQTLALKGDI